MEVIVRDLARRKIRKLVRRYPDIGKLLDDTLQLYVSNPRNPKLRLHKLSGDQRWSISIKNDLRLIFVYWKGCIAVVDVGSHDEVY